MQLIHTISRMLAGPATAFTTGVERVMFRADWIDALFIHFELAAQILQPFVPFELDTFESRAHVSLVAFTQRNLRPARGGWLAAALTTPIAAHEFLNLRTYVRCGRESGIYFIAEWIPNRPAVLIGPRTYGLPYRLARHRYRYGASRGAVEAIVRARGGRLDCRGRIASTPFVPAPSGTLDHFLLERYTAFTHRGSISRCFRIAHRPWSQKSVQLDLVDCSILKLGGEWHRHARFVGANFSPGVDGVLISVPVLGVRPHSGTGPCFRAQ